MGSDPATVLAFLEGIHPYDTLPPAALAEVAGAMQRRSLPPGAAAYRFGEALDGLFLVERGQVEITDANGAPVSILGPRNSFGERGLMRDGHAATTARALGAATVLMLPAARFRRLVDDSPAFARFFTRGAAARPDGGSATAGRGGPPGRGATLATLRVAELVTRAPISCAPATSVAEAARAMRDAHVSSLGVTDGDGRLVGIVTQRDLSDRVLAEGRDPAVAVEAVMTRDPVTLPREALGSDVLSLMLGRGVGHLPVTEAGRFVGMVTQTDLTRFQAVTAGVLIHDIGAAGDVAALAQATGRIPALLVQLVGASQSHEVVTRLITDVADAVTRRLVALAEARLGPAPVPYVWAACGSQGRQEQTGHTDQDNCLIFDDAATADDRRWFEALAQEVCTGLDACGYVFCPGEMMAMTPRWCQPLAVWQGYFRGWIARPDPMAQMLASVMFDLRPIAGDRRLFDALQAETLAAASQNTIFTAHMIANSLKHAPPLGLLRGFATIRSGEHRHQIDMKLNGVVPVTDLARVYALLARIPAVNTRARLVAAEGRGVLSVAGGRDLVAAYDLIADQRLAMQAALVRSGRKPDNFLAPSDLSEFERSHLRDAFVVVRTMQSALGHGRVAAT
ncbi:DUF294 nucleotidyltransferase-like domain-containing protein [Frigidibacter sp. MR17.24]|uniref:DUF294 nucleotidyltransferase-like domain-containing protein n=1 Tax=Frigidibacter sp. MR17.24 TaxID=3127345 RepID=UPI003012A79B